MVRTNFLQTIAALVVAAALGAAASTAEAQNTCNAFVAISIAPPGVVVLGGTRTITLSVGTDGIQGGTKLTVNRLRYDLDCNGDASLGLPCTDQGDIFSYVGDSTITTTCGVTWTSNVPAGGHATNEIVFTPSTPIDILTGINPFCDLSFDIALDNLDPLVGPDSDSSPQQIEVVAGFRTAPSDAVCNNGLKSGANQSAAIEIIAPTPTNTPTETPTSTPTETPTPTSTFTSTETPTPTQTPTVTETPTVTPTTVGCGNSVIDPGEQCDDGPGNSDTTPDACRTNCVLPGCNDGVPDAPVVDFVLVIETSVSMRRDLRQIHDTLGALPDEFALAGADFRIAVVRFATGRLHSGPDFPEILQDFTSSTPVYQAAIDVLQTKITGPTEAGTEAFDLALDNLVFRPNAIPVFLLFTDEDDDLPVSIERSARREPPGGKWLTSPRRPQFQMRLDEVASRLIAKKARLAMVINRRNKPTEFQYGSPRATRLDGMNHLDQAMTLAALTSMQMQDSLQGQLLSAGTCTAGTCTAGREGFSCTVDEECGLPARAYEIKEARRTNLGAFFAALRADLIAMGSCAP